MKLKHVIIMTGLFLFVLSFYIFSDESKAFCVDTNELSEELQKKYIPGSDSPGRMSQGFCVADNRIIYTRYTSDYANTTYVILDANTMEELNQQEFNTQHSNSLTYNPNTKEVVAVSNNHAFVFSFDGLELTLEHDYYLEHNCPKIAYVESEDTYYLGTSTQIFETKDFTYLNKVFEVPQIAINQGMGSDGKDLFIVWYQDGYCSIYQYSTNGSHINTYTLHSSILHEIEEVDFYGEHMLISIENSGFEKNGLYQVNNHHAFGGWTVTLEASCGEDGLKERTCEKCGFVGTKRIPLTEQHDHSGWEIIKEATCSEMGKQVQSCTICGTRLMVQSILPTGHIFDDWTIDYAPTVYEDGYRSRHCKQCGYMEQELLPKLEASISMDRSRQTMWHGQVLPPRCVKLMNGDHIKSWVSDKPWIVKVDGAGSIYALGYGTAHISCITEAGKTAVYTVQVSRLESIKHWFWK